MDILYHAVVGVVISKSFGGDYNASSAFFSVLPDVIGVAPYYYYKLKSIPVSRPESFFTRFYHATTSNIFSNSVDRTVYRATHSLFSACIIAMILYTIGVGGWLPLSLSYLSHIIIDIPTHDKDLSTRLLFPFSDIHIQAYNWAVHMKTFIGFWILLLFIFYVL